MLLVSHDQMGALGNAQGERYAARLADSLVSDFPAVAAHPRTTVLSFVRKSMQEARGYGITMEGEVTFYVRLHMTLGVGFKNESRFGWIVDILRRSDLTGAEKIDRIHDRFVFSGIPNGTR